MRLVGFTIEILSYQAPVVWSEEQNYSISYRIWTLESNLDLAGSLQSGPVFRKYLRFSIPYHSGEILVQKDVPWWSLKPRHLDWVRDYFWSNLFSLPSPCLLPVPETDPLPATPFVSFEPSTKYSWAGQCRAAVLILHIFSYYICSVGRVAQLV